MPNRVIRSCTITTMHPPRWAGPPQATHCPRQAAGNAGHASAASMGQSGPAWLRGPAPSAEGRPHHHLSGKSAKRRLARKATGSLPLWSSPVLRRSDGCDTVTRQASRGEVAEASEVRPPKLWAGATLGSRHLDWLGAFPDSTAGCAPHSSAGQWRTSQHSRHSRWRQRTAGVIPASLALVR